MLMGAHLLHPLLPARHQNDIVNDYDLGYGSARHRCQNGED
jgi:hypothetical protein